MHLNSRKCRVFCVLALASAATHGCSADSGTAPLGFPAAGSASGGAGGTVAGGSNPGLGGTGFTNAAGGLGGSSTPVAGTFGSAGVPGAGSSGAASGGAASSGAGGAASGTGGAASGAGGSAPIAGTGAGGSVAGAGGSGIVLPDFPDGCPAPAGTHSANALTRDCWLASASDCAASAANMNPPLGAIDAAGSATRFSTGVQMVQGSAYTFWVDLGETVSIDGVTVTSAGTDYAPQLEVDVSMDGASWTPVACGAGSVVTDFAFEASDARYVRVKQFGTQSKWWSIHDFNVFRAGAGDSCAGGGTPATGACTISHTQ